MSDPRAVRVCLPNVLCQSNLPSSFSHKGFVNGKPGYEALLHMFVFKDADLHIFLTSSGDHPTIISEIQVPLNGGNQPVCGAASEGRTQVSQTTAVPPKETTPRNTKNKNSPSTTFVFRKHMQANILGHSFFGGAPFWGNLEDQVPPS